MVYVDFLVFTLCHGLSCITKPHFTIAAQHRQPSAGDICESRCLRVLCDTTDPEHPRVAVRGSAVSGEKRILVVEPTPSAWTFKAPWRRQHTTLASASRRRHLRSDPSGGNRQSPFPILPFTFLFPVFFLATFLSSRSFFSFSFSWRLGLTLCGERP